MDKNLNQNFEINQFQNNGFKESIRSKASKQRIKSLILLMCFTITILITSVYAWFSTQKNVSINNIKGKVEVAEGLQISLDAKTWSQQINLGSVSGSIIDSYWDEYDAGIGTNVKVGDGSEANAINVSTSNVRPKIIGVTSGENSIGYMNTVSTTGRGILRKSVSYGSVTNKDTGICFYTGNYVGIQLKEITPIISESTGGYYGFDIYIMNTSQESEKDQLQLNFNSMVKEIPSASGTDYGLKNCVRVALVLFGQKGINGTSTEFTTSINANQNTVLYETEKYGFIKQVAIWEPNCDTHSGYVMSQNSKLRKIVDGVANSSTPAKNNTTSTILNTYAVKYKEDYSGVSINDVYNYADTNLEYVQYVNQTSGNLASSAIYNGVVYVDDKGTDAYTDDDFVSTIKLNDMTSEANATGVVNLKDINNANFELKANSISKIRVYVWLEGQDPDCINWATHSGGIGLTLGLCKDSIEGDTTEPQSEYRKTASKSMTIEEWRAHTD